MHRESVMVMGHNAVPMLPPLLVVPIFRWQSSVRVDSRVLFVPLLYSTLDGKDTT